MQKLNIWRGTKSMRNNLRRIAETSVCERACKPGGILVSSVAPVPEAMQKSYGIRSAYFYVDVTTARRHRAAAGRRSRRP